jgi:hypothetical protein
MTMLLTEVAAGVPAVKAPLGALVAAPLASVRVDFDATFVYAALLFVALMLALNRILFIPL